MQQNINYQALTEKWAPLLDYEGVDKITDAHRRNVTAVLPVSYTHLRAHETDS